MPRRLRHFRKANEAVCRYRVRDPEWALSRLEWRHALAAFETQITTALSNIGGIVSRHDCDRLNYCREQLASATGKTTTPSKASDAATFVAASAFLPHSSETSGATHARRTQLYAEVTWACPGGVLLTQITAVSSRPSLRS